MLTGRPPFLGDAAVTVISQHLNTAPVSPTWHNAEVTPAIEALVLALLEKDPAARPADAGAVVAELRRLQAVRPAASAGASSPSGDPARTKWRPESRTFLAARATSDPGRGWPSAQKTMYPSSRSSSNSRESRWRANSSIFAPRSRIVSRIASCRPLSSIVRL